MKTTLIAAAFLSATLAACGGGGSSTTTTVTATTFALQAGYKAYVAAGGSTNYTISGTCSGTLTDTTAQPVAATFESTTGYSQAETLTTSFTNCSPATSASTDTYYYDKNYTLVGTSSSSGYGDFVNLPAPFPTSVQVGDTAEYGTEYTYTDSSKATATGKLVLSYVIEADGTSTTTAIVNIVSRSYDTSGNLIYTQQARHRIDSSGNIADVSIDVQYSTTSTSHFVFTKA